MDGLPTGWLADLWAAAKTAGPFGNMSLLIALVVVWRKLNRAEAAILSLTVSGLKAINGVSTALKGIQKDLSQRVERRNRR